MPPSSADLVPRRLGDFEIVRELGRGGMGVVYEARQLSLNRKVALKVLASGAGLTARAVERFRREAEAAAKLHHTNIVPVYATGEQDGVHFYAMELIAGPSLDHVLRSLRGPSSAAAAAPELAATGPYVAGAAGRRERPGPGAGARPSDSPGAAPAAQHAGEALPGDGLRQPGGQGPRQSLPHRRPDGRRPAALREPLRHLRQARGASRTAEE